MPKELLSMKSIWTDSDTHCSNSKSCRIIRFDLLKGQPTAGEDGDLWTFDLVP